MSEDSPATQNNKNTVRAALAYSLANGLLLATLIAFARVFQLWWADGQLVLDEHVAFTFIFWFFGGALIGYMSWRKKRAQAEQIQQAEKD